MYDLVQITKIIEDIGSIKKNITDLILQLKNSRIQDLNLDEISLIKDRLEEIKKILKIDSEYYYLFFFKKISLFYRAYNDLFVDSFFHKCRFNKYLETRDSNDLTNLLNSLNYLNQELTNKIQATCYYLLSLHQNLTIGSAKTPLPRNEITEYEIYGPIRHLLYELEYILKKWARNNNMNVLIWIGGSAVDGVSPVKGLFKGDKFIAYKPIDYRRVSDIDIGIGLDRITYGLEIPAYLQTKDRTNINNPFGQKILSLCSDSIDKDRIKKEFNPRYALKYINLIERLEPLKLKNFSLKERGIHLQFFLLDAGLPKSRDLQRFQRKFLIFDNFKQPNLAEEEITQKIKIQVILKKILGDHDKELDSYILKRIYEGAINKNTLKIEAKKISQKFNIAKKKSERILNEIVRILKH